MGIAAGARRHRRYATQCSRRQTAHPVACPLRHVPMNSPLTPFFLRGEGERNLVCLGKGSDWITGGVEDLSAAAESNVAEAEWSGLVFGAGVAVLAGAHEEVEANPDDICDALCFCVPVGVVLEDVVEDCDGEGFDVFWRRGLLSVASLLAQNPEVGVAKSIKQGVAGPHAGEDLAHGTQVLLHLPFFDRFYFFLRARLFALDVQKNGEKGRDC